MMKGGKDFALEYMIELGIKPAKSYSGFISHLTKTCGQQTANKIAALISARGEGKASGDSFYAVKNQDLNTSIAVNGGYDGDVIRRICDWISNNKHVFGEQILDVGCDNGLISCFIAKMLPESKVTAIDRCQEAIVVAQALANRLGVNNIDFRHVNDLSTIDEQFKTVFSSRTMHENLDLSCIEENITLLLREQGKNYAKATATYANILSSLIVDSGNLVTVDRAERNPLYLGWLLSLNSNGIVMQPEYYAELVCREIENTDSRFQVTVATKQESACENAVYNAFCETFARKIPLDLAQYKDWDAAVMLQNSLDSLIEGYRIYEKSGKCIAKVALWTNLGDADSILAEQHIVPTGIHLVSNCYANALENCLESIRGTARGAFSLNQTVMKLGYENGQEFEVEEVRQIDE